MSARDGFFNLSAPRIAAIISCSVSLFGVCLSLALAIILPPLRLRSLRLILWLQVVNGVYCVGRPDCLLS